LHRSSHSPHNDLTEQAKCWVQQADWLGLAAMPTIRQSAAGLAGSFFGQFAVVADRDLLPSKKLSNYC
jgi:hypothetical protein